jgi:Rieske Fe-S protein
MHQSRLKMEGSRRGFIARVLMVIGTLVWLPGVVGAKKKKVAVSLKKIPKLNTVGGATVLKLKKKMILFVRTTNTDVTAVSALCTHDSCQLLYNPSSKRIECVCHGSHFTPDGKVLGGPAKSNLHNFEAKLVDEKIVLNIG